MWRTFPHCTEPERWQCEKDSAHPFEDGRRGPGAKGCKQILDAGKGKGIGSSLKLPERNTVLTGQNEDTLILALRDIYLTSEL